MDSTFTINGHKASLVETQKAFAAAGFDPKAIPKGDLTPAKIAQVIHPDGKPLTMDDLRRLQSDSSARLRKLLQSKGVDLYATAQDFDKTLSAYMQDRFGSGKANTDLIPEKMWQDREFVLRAVHYSGSTLQFADPKLRNDPEIVLAAVKSDGLALEHAGGKLKSNPEIVKEAIKNNYMALEFASPEFKSDPKLILSMIKTAAGDPTVAGTSFPREILEMADPKVRKDPTLMLEAGKIDPTVFELIHEDLGKDKKFVMAMVNVHGLALQYADEKYQSDPEIVMAAVKQSGAALAYADPSIQKNHPDIVKTAVRQSNDAFNYIDPDLKSEQRFLVELAQTNHNILDKLGPIRREKVWRDLQPILKAQGITFPKEMMTSYESFKEGLKPMTECPERFRSFKTIYTYWNNRQNLQGYKGTPPLALAIYPPKKGDHNGAYAASPVLDDLADSGKFYTLYTEATTQSKDGGLNRQQVLAAIKVASHDGKYPIHTLILGGHGDGKTLALGGEDLGAKNDKSQGTGKTEGKKFDEAYYIDIDDFKTGLKDIRKYLDPQGQVWIRSCYSGKGGENGENLENAAASVLPDTMSLYGYRKSTTTNGLVVNNDLSIEPKISPPMPYVTRGRLAKEQTPTQQVSGVTTQRRLSGI